MGLPFDRQFGLVARGGPGLACDSDGLALGAVPLAVVVEGKGGPRCRLRPDDEIKKALALAYGSALDRPLGDYLPGLRRIAELIGNGELGRAELHAVLLGLPSVAPVGMAKLGADEELKKSNDSWEGEPRVDAGQEGAGEWTDGGSAEAASLHPAAFQGVSPEGKAAFVRAHLADAAKAARTLGVPIENVLGVAALESQWGTSRFAQEGKNLFGMYYPAPLSRRPIPALNNKKARLAGYDSYADSFESFARNYKTILGGESDPVKFAQALQDKGKFGRNTADGSKVPGYVPDVAATIRKLRRYVVGSTT